MKHSNRPASVMLAALLILCCLCAAGCASVHPIVGQWGDGNFAFFEFAQDNTMMIMFVGKSTSGTYLIENDLLTITTTSESGQQQSVTYTFLIENNTLVLTDSAGTSESYPKI